jgi:hypothetical protein
MNGSSGIPKATIFYSVSPNGFYQGSILVFSCQKLNSGGTSGTGVFPKMSKGFSVLPGFVPAADLLFGVSRRVPLLLWREK